MKTLVNTTTLAVLTLLFAISCSQPQTTIDAPEKIDRAASPFGKMEVPEEIKPFETPFGTFNFARPEFPDAVVNIQEFGAQAGGKTLNTEAINKAISELSEKGGGKVVVPAGVWLTGPIILKSNINLYLEEGAELLFSQNFDHYLPAVLTNWEGNEVYSYSPFIYAVEQENIAITGKGVLNGQGKPWWEHRGNGVLRAANTKLRKMNVDGVPVEERVFDNKVDYLPPVFFGPIYCKNILLEGVSFKYGAFWTINPSYCENLIVRDLYVLTNGEYGDTPNGDGINPNSCKDVLIEYNTLDTGDDCITIKSSRDVDGRRIGLPCKNILIRHNVGLQGHGGIVIGSEMSGGVENLYAHDCKFNGTDRALRIKTQRGRGAYVKNCWFKNISADSIEREAIRINMLYHGDRLPAQEVTEETPYIENIHFENVSCEYSKRNIIQIIGIPEMPVKNVTFKNISVAGKKGMDIRDAKNVSFENLTLSNIEGPLASIIYSDSLMIDGLKIGATSNDVPFNFLDLTNSSLSGVETELEGTLVKISGNSSNVSFDESVKESRIERE